MPKCRENWRSKRRRAAYNAQRRADWFSAKWFARELQRQLRRTYERIADEMAMKPVFGVSCDLVMCVQSNAAPLISNQLAVIKSSEC